MSGRGFGKTRSGAEDVKAFGLTHPKSRIAVGAPTFADGRDTCVEGESGLLSVLPADSVRNWNRSMGELYLTNGTRYKVISGEKPAKGRGPQWMRMWGDEIAEWRRPETWHQLMLGLRLGDDPRAVATGTPKPVELIRELVADPDTHITTGATYENRRNLAPAFFKLIMRRYEGTTMGRQEILGELLSEMPGALWQRAIIEEHRVSPKDALRLEDMEKIVVGLDPEGTAAGDSESGIVVAGKVGDHAYVLADLSEHLSPEGWASRAIAGYRSHEADYIVAETNQGGDMVKHTIRTVDRSVPVHTVHAKRGKALRADPVVSLYEQGRVHHVGTLGRLEDQQCSFTRKEQPLGSDRVDALVYALMELNPSAGRRKKPRGGKVA